ERHSQARYLNKVSRDCRLRTIGIKRRDLRTRCRCPDADDKIGIQDIGCTRNALMIFLQHADRNLQCYRMAIESCERIDFAIFSEITEIENSCKIYEERIVNRPAE